MSFANSNAETRLAPTTETYQQKLKRRVRELEAEVAKYKARSFKLEAALRKAFSIRCGYDDCRVMTGKVNDPFCLKHQIVYQALAALDGEGGEG